MNRRAFVIGIIGLAGCTGGDASDESDGDVEVVDAEWTVIEEYDHAQDHYGVELVGENVSGETLEVFCTARFLDDDGVQLGDATRSASGVPPGGRFELTLAYTGDEPDRVTDYELEFEVYRD